LIQGFCVEVVTMPFDLTMTIVRCATWNGQLHSRTCPVRYHLKW